VGWHCHGKGPSLGVGSVADEYGTRHHYEVRGSDELVPDAFNSGGSIVY
jgi:hypothetical protein